MQNSKILPANDISDYNKGVVSEVGAPKKHFWDCKLHDC